MGLVLLTPSLYKEDDDIEYMWGWGCQHLLFIRWKMILSVCGDGVANTFSL